MMEMTRRERVLKATRGERVDSGKQPSRRGAMYGIGLGIALALVYWIAMSVFGAVGASGVIHPLLAAWAPNIIFAASAAYNLLLTVRT